MNLKLKYSISAKTGLSSDEIITRAQKKLDSDKYTIVHVGIGLIEFKDNPWAVRWNFAPFKLDGGEIITSNELTGEKLVTLKFYVNFLQPLFGLGFLIVMMLAEGGLMDGIIFFLIFFTIAMTIENLRARFKAKELLADVLKTDNQLP